MPGNASCERPSASRRLRCLSSSTSPASRNRSCARCTSAMGRGRSLSASSARTPSPAGCSPSCLAARCARWPDTSAPPCRSCAAARITRPPPRACGGTWSRLLAEREGVVTSPASTTGLRCPPIAHRAASRSPASAGASCRTGRASTGCCARGNGALRRQGRLRAQPRRQPLPRARATGRAGAGDAHPGARRVVLRDGDRARGGPAGGGRRIKRLAPPYNVALVAEGRAVFYATTALDRVRLRPEGSDSIGPLGSRAPIEALGALRTALASREGASVTRVVRARAAGVEPPWAPVPECFAAGLARFAQEHGRLFESVRRLQPLGKRLWALRQDGDVPRAEPDEPGAEPPRAPGSPPGTRNG